MDHRCCSLRLLLPSRRRIVCKCPCWHKHRADPLVREVFAECVVRLGPGKTRILVHTNFELPVRPVQRASPSTTLGSSSNQQSRKKRRIRHGAATPVCIPVSIFVVIAGTSMAPVSSSTHAINPAFAPPRAFGCAAGSPHSAGVLTTGSRRSANSTELLCEWVCQDQYYQQHHDIQAFRRDHCRKVRDPAGAG
jgi:hypothetical protein